jgi:hypothetical protein
MQKIQVTNNSKAMNQMYNHGVKNQAATGQAPRPRTSVSERERRGQEYEEPARPLKRRKSDPQSQPQWASGGGNPGNSVTNKVELVFEPHPDDAVNLSELHHKFLTTTPDCTVAHLARYLTIRLREDGSETDPAMEAPAFYTPGSQGYKRWRNNEPLRNLMEWRLRDQDLQRDLKAPFTIVFAHHHRPALGRE